MIRIDARPADAFTELLLLEGTKPLPVESWPLSGHPGADLCQLLIAEGNAIEDGETLHVEHSAIARLSAAEAKKLDLPPATALRAVVEGNGVMLRPDFSVTLRWVRPGGQAVLGASRTGAWLKQAEGWRRLPETMFAVGEAVDALSSVAKSDEAGRLRAIARLREALPQAATEGAAEATGLLGRVTIIEADAFSLDTTGEGDAMQLVPVLHRAGEPEKLLPEDRQHAFGTQQFPRWPNARPFYSLPGGIYITLSPPLRAALEVVRRAASSPIEQRRALLREPRAAIRAAIGEEADLAVVEALLVETPQWADRVIGLGLWQPRVLPWIALPANDWLGGIENGPRKPSFMGLQVGDRCLRLTLTEAASLASRIEDARDRGQTSIIEATPDGPLAIPATAETLQALAPAERAPKAAGFGEKPLEILMPLIKPNETELDIEAFVQARTTPPLGVPESLITTPKPHQREGIAWLQHSFRAGSPGVLLADDMGLGKTLQGLAFLAWLRDGMASGVLARRPLLIVAPTGLLENWRAEHSIHLEYPGLGTLLPAYGNGLAGLRAAGPDGAPGLDRSAIANADWVLTTYETLRDYSRDFAAIRFAAMLMDEAQKVKTPAIRLTDAAKAMHADFRIALTGTPVENRLTDLWCIVDGVAPGHLGDLRRFSAQFEGPDAAERLPSLKASLDRTYGGRPPLLLRRLKEDRLPELPPCIQTVSRAPMQGGQLAAYEAALASARDDQGAGRILEALHRLRITSLRPDQPQELDDAALIAASARLRLALAVLDRVHEAGERALVFLDDLAMMARLSALLQRRYRMQAPPMTISGEVAGQARQTRVNRFQDAPEGFDVMLLSPKAGGVGLTLTRARHVIHLARWWNPAVEDQSTARVHRIGQTRPVEVHLPLATLPDGKPSFDETLHALLERKRRLMHDALMPPELDRGELASMLSETLA